MFKRIVALLLTVSLAGGWPVLAQGDPDPGALAVEYLKAHQNEDGGLSNGWVPESDLVTTADVVIAAVAAGQDATDFPAGDPVIYLETQVSEGHVTAAGVIAKVLIAVVAAGQDATDFGGHHLLDDLLATQAESGLFGNGTFDHCLAMIALQNAGAELPAGTVEVLVFAQNDDGGWGFMAGEASDTNSTGLCLQALALTDSVKPVTAGFAYLIMTQNEDSGWPYQNPSDFGTDSDTNSTALVVQALLAHDQDLAEWENPQVWLRSMQNESGAFRYQAAVPDDNVLATVAAIPVVAGVPLIAWIPAPDTAE